MREESMTFSQRRYIEDLIAECKKRGVEVPFELLEIEKKSEELNILRKALELACEYLYTHVPCPCEINEFCKEDISLDCKETWKEYLINEGKKNGQESVNEENEENIKN